VTEHTAVYRLYDADDVLLYVGISARPEHRWAQHRAEKAWWGDVATREVTWFSTRGKARAAEVNAIRCESPRHNIAETPLHRVVSTTPVNLERAHPIAQRLAARLKALATVSDPLARGKVSTVVLAQISEANSTLSALRRDDIKAMRADGMSYRAIGAAIGIHFTRVKQIESGVPTGNSARSRAAKAGADG
jgi:predicted GIY-YIG superfamily endonuclease